MKYCLTIATMLAMAGATYSQAEEVLPPQYNFDRYSKMVDQSPFAVATAVAAPAATPDFAKDLYIANAARSQDGDLVTIASTGDHNFKKYLTTKTPVDGYGISSIEWSDKVGETKVTISKDSQYATLTFNQAEMTKPVPNRQPSAPNLPQPPGFTRPMGLSTPTPRTRGLLGEKRRIAHSPDREAEQDHDDADHDHDLEQSEARSVVLFSHFVIAQTGGGEGRFNSTRENFRQSGVCFQQIIRFFPNVF